MSRPVSSALKNKVAQGRRPGARRSLARKASPEQSLKSLKSLAAFAQLNPNPVLQFSGDGRMTYCNDAATRMATFLGKEHPSAMLPAETPVIVQTCLATGHKRLH